MRVAAGCRMLMVVGVLGLIGCQGESPPQVAADMPPAGPQGDAVRKPAPSWKRFQPEGGRFSVLLPQEPQISSQPGQLFTVHIATCTEDGADFYVTYFDPPAGSIAPNVAEATMKRDRDMSIQDIQGTLKSEAKVTIPAAGRTWPGLESVMENAASVYKSRLYAVGGRMYSLQVIYPKGQDRSAEITKFFESFEVSGVK